MERINQIINHSKYIDLMDKLNLYEQNRIYCKHDLTHQLDVARIAYIIVLEKGLRIEKELLYAAALLHDIGRVKTYETGEEHHEAGAKLANEILKECGFNEDERNEICSAILNHRLQSDEMSTFEKVLYKADKMSRNCFACKARSTCKWPDEKKNFGIKP